MIESIFNFSTIATETTPTRPVARLSEEERLDTLSRHLAADLYFRRLSTLLGFVEDALVSGDTEIVAILLEAVPSARRDLAHLHDNYHIKPRS